MRNAFADELCKLAAVDSRVMLLSGDIGNNLFNTFKKICPNQFLNCGAAEAGMTGVAAGLALCGLRPVTYSIAAFNPGRCAEQVRLDLALHNLPVVVVGVGAGLSYSSLGPTHHSLEDIAWMRPIPGMSILCPSDAVSTRCALRAVLKHDGPTYLRLGKKNEPVVYEQEPDFAIGKSLPVKPWGCVCLVSVGTMLPTVLEAAALLDAQGISAGVLDLLSVKPLDVDMLEKIFAEVDLVAVVEEHVPAGGAWSALAEWLSQQPARKARLLRCGTEDAFFTEGGGQGWARKHFGLTAEGVAERVAAVLNAGAGTAV